MRFLIKSAFWLCLALFFIPLPKDHAPSAERTISATEAVGAAQVALSDIKGFCGRNPGACEVGQAALVSVGERAKVGAKMVYEYLDTQLPADKQAGAVPAAVAPVAAPPQTTASVKVRTVPVGEPVARKDQPRG